MSEQDNISRINNVYAAFGRGDVDYILNQLTDDVRWVTHFDAVVPRAGDYPGKQNVSRFFQAIAESVEVTAFIPSEYVAQADTVVSMGQFGCKVRATGKAASSRWVFIWKFREGRICDYEQFHDPELAKLFSVEFCASSAT